MSKPIILSMESFAPMREVSEYLARFGVLPSVCIECREQRADIAPRADGAYVCTACAVHHQGGV